MRRGILAAAVLVSAASLACAEPVASGASPEVRAFNANLVEKTAGAAGVFAAEPDGSVRHVQSGLVCAAEFPGFHMMDLQIYAPSGADVGCDYARIGAGNRIVSKLTIFLVKAPADATLDAVFDRYRGEITATFPAALPADAVLKIGDRTDYRAIGYTVPQEDGGHHHTELVVGLREGWIVEIRATYANSVIQIGRDTPKEEIAGQLFDIENTYIAYMSVMGLK